MNNQSLKYKALKEMEKRMQQRIIELKKERETYLGNPYLRFPERSRDELYELQSEIFKVRDEIDNFYAKEMNNE